ncbi:MAG: tripartite tricarboxylate transporter permease, partial [Angustibacter sp.]
MQWNELINGFSIALTPINLAFAIMGVLLGTAIGVLPGIGPAMAIALLLPIAAGQEVMASFILFAGIYYGAMYGGSTASILLNTPGETNSVVTAIEGHRMALAGRAPQALATAAIGSFIAGALGTAGLVLFAPLLTKFAINLGEPSYFALMIL